MFFSPSSWPGQRIDAELRARALKVLDDLGLAGCEDYFPSQLSGGMKKRVELARALVTEPELLILDEPFSSLDIITREKLNILLRSLHRRTRCTVVMVTHSVEEACFLSDRIVVFTSLPAQVIDVRDLGKNGEEPPDQYLLSQAERDAAAGIRKNARVLWAAIPEPVSRAGEERTRKGKPDAAGGRGSFLQQILRMDAHPAGARGRCISFSCSSRCTSRSPTTSCPIPGGSCTQVRRALLPTARSSPTWE